MRILVSRIFALAIGALLLVTTSHWNDCVWMRRGLFLVAVLLVGVGALGRMWCSSYIAGRKNAELVTGGPYSVCRNPLYFFSLLGAVGLGFATGTFTIPALIALGFALKYPGTIRGEEEYLAKRHGEPFAKYTREVPRFWPRWSLLQEPEKYEMNPRTFRKHLGSVVWFIWALGLLPLLLEGVRYGQSQGWLKVLTTLY